MFNVFSEVMILNWGWSFFLQCIGLGAGLAMDAFSVSMADGLNEPCMKKGKMCGIAGTFAIYQGIMPFIGWLFVHTLVECFHAFQPFIPWIALGLLLFIGGKMLADGIKNDCADGNCNKLGFGALMLQGVATSIDALSVGFTIAEYDVLHALVAAAVIAVLTFFICFAGLFIGKKFGTKLSNKAQIFGGIILILIGIEIFVTGVFF